MPEHQSASDKQTNKYTDTQTRKKPRLRSAHHLQAKHSPSAKPFSEWLGNVGLRLQALLTRVDGGSLEHRVHVEAGNAHSSVTPHTSSDLEDVVGRHIILGAQRLVVKARQHVGGQRRRRNSSSSSSNDFTPTSRSACYTSSHARSSSVRTTRGVMSAHLQPIVLRESGM